MNWQPIETAPTNKRVLIFIPKAEILGSAVYRAIKVVDLGATESRWHVSALYGGIDIDPFYAPTHWMPLPEPPKDGAA